MEPKTNSRLLLIGSTQGDVHLSNYYSLIKDHFQEILIVTGNDVDFCNSIKLNFGLKNPFTVLKSVKRLKRIINEFSPTIIHVHQANSYCFLTSLANRGERPQVLTVWGSDVLLLPKKGFIYKYIVKKGLRSSDKITADAQFIEDKIEDLVGPVDFTTANFGIDLPNIIVDPSKKEKIIYSNRLHESLYNIDRIILAFIKFQKKHTDWKLIIAGSGPETDYLNELARDLPESSYSFVGFVNSETNLNHYKKASFFTSIPSSDGTSISLLEAMACGAAPILSNLPANHEWVKSGYNGIIVTGTLENAFEKALKLDISEVAKLNKDIIEKKATKESNRKIYLDVYNDLLT